MQAISEDALRTQFIAGLAGDQISYQGFLKACAAALRAYYRNRLRSDPSTAEDLVQDVLLAIHAKRDSYDPGEPICPWIYAIARYRLIDHLRRRGRRGVHIPLDDTDSLFSDAEDTASDARMDVNRLLAQLPSKQRIAIENVKIQERSVEETAAHMGISVSDVKISIHRGVKALARLVAQETAQ